MREITMDRLLTDLKGVVDEFNQMVANKDIEGVRKALGEIEHLVKTQKGVRLDQDITEPDYDHVFHELLSKIGGNISRETIIPGTKGSISIEIETITRRLLILIYERFEVVSEIRFLNGQPVISIDDDIAAQIKDLENQKQRVRDAWETAAKMGRVTKESEANWQKQIDDIDAQIKELQERTDFLAKNTEKAKAAVQKRIAEVEAELKRRQEAWQNMSQMRDLKKEQDESWQQGIDDLNAELNELRRQLDILNRAGKIPVRDDNNRNEIEIREIDESIYSLEVELRRTEEIWRKKITRTVKPSKEEEIEWKKKTEELRIELTKLTAELTVLEQSGDTPIDITALTKELEELDQQIGDTEKEIKRRTDAWHNMSAMRDLTKEEDQNWEKGIDELKAKLAELQKKREELAKRIEDSSTEKTVEKELGSGYIGMGSPLAKEVRRILADHGLTMTDEQIAILEQKNVVTVDGKEYSIYWSGADGEDYTDDPVTPFTLKVKEKQIEPKKVDNSAIIAELKLRIERLTIEIKNREEAWKIRVNGGKGFTAQEEEEYRRVTESLKIRIEELRRRRLEIINHKGKLTPEEIAVRRKYLEERLTIIDQEITETRVKIREIEGKPGSRTVENLDVTAEVNRIGDKIFKTNKIRKALAERQVSREEFLEFYRAGLANSQQITEDLKRKSDEIYEELVRICTEKDTGENLRKRFQEHEKSNNVAGQIEVAEKIRQNLLANGNYDVDVVKKPIQTEEDLKEFVAFMNELFNTSYDEIKKLGQQINEQEENREIFQREIDKIEKELETIAQARKGIGATKAEADQEKALRAKQIRADMHGDEKLKKEYNERFQRFYSHKVTRTAQYIDADGNPKDVEFETIEDYPEYEEDAYFLDLHDYRTFLEATTLYRNSGNDEKALGADRIAAIQQDGKLLEEVISEKEHYVSTFHGQSNKYKIKAENYMTAGSTLKSMIPLKGLSPMKKVGAGIENTFRFFGIRVPKFTRLDENGQKVSDIKGGVTTLLVDAAVVGSVAAAGIIGGPAALSAIGIGYAAKGVVTAGNRVAGRITRRKHADEIENNIPTPYENNKDAREVARKDYYRRVEGRGKLSSWLRAKNDRIFARKRAEETEEKIIEERIAESDAAIDARTETARNALAHNLQQANKNQSVREENFRIVSQGKNTYNDIVRDPDSVDMAQTTSIIAQNAAVQSHGNHGRDVNPDSDQPHQNQYVKDEEPLGKTDDLLDIKTKGGTVAAVSVTEEERYTGRQQKQDRINKVATIILTAAGKLGLDVIRGKTLKHWDEYKTRRGPDKTETYDITETKTVTEVEIPDKVSDVQVSTDGLNDIYDVGGVISQGNTGTINDVGAATLDYVAEDGTRYTVEIAQKGLGFLKRMNGVGHVHELVDGDLSQMTIQQLFSKLASGDPTHWPSFIKAIGMENATQKEIIEFCMKKGLLSLQDKAMSGWQRMIPAKITEKVIEEVVGQGIRTVPGDLITDVIHHTAVDPWKIAKAAAEGAAAGAAIKAADDLHEAAHQTKKRQPGTFEQRSPDLGYESSLEEEIDSRIESRQQGHKLYPHGNNFTEDREI